MPVRAKFAEIYLRAMRDRSMPSVTELACQPNDEIESFGGKRAVGFLLKIELCQKRSKFRM